MSNPIFEANKKLLDLRPCEQCDSFETYRYATPEECTANKKLTTYSHISQDGKCIDHDVEKSPARFTHFKINGTWHATRQKFAFALVSLVPVEEALTLSGGLDYPRPVRIDSLTDLLTLCLTHGATEEQLKQFFPPAQIERMRGRTFQRLVHPKKRR